MTCYRDAHKKSEFELVSFDGFIKFLGADKCNKLYNDLFSYAVFLINNKLFKEAYDLLCTLNVNHYFKKENDIAVKMLLFACEHLKEIKDHPDNKNIKELLNYISEVE